VSPTGPQSSLLPGAFSLPGVVRALEAALGTAAAEASGAIIGPYKLLQKLGEGGFGIVWMAEQHEPIRRRVALKIIKTGMDTEEVIARFEAERQALALMDHANIARVFDAGATATGRPYFVMELVRGIAITRYCDDNRLGAEARLRLFIAVCKAVQHAHQKGIIHRDLKPSNILVTLHDGVPVPKIIDFGIAKATDKELTEKTLFTQFHAFMGTPAYTSPEQMEMSGLDIDTRSDIYSLGVLLYELLAGRPPFDPDALVKSGLEAMRRTVREIDPPRPSTRLGTLPDADRTSVALQRGTDAGKLSLLLRGDLDWIAMRCLEKDRTRRYETASALASDIERHLAHEPVSARPPSQLYRARKFVRRYRVGVAATTAIAVSVVGGLIASSWSLVRERAAHERALLAEQQQAELRHQAETARELEVRRTNRTSLALAEQLMREGKTSDGLAYLVHVARKDPSNLTLAPRIASVLTSRNFLPPSAAPVRLASPALLVRYIDAGRTIAVLCEDGTTAAISIPAGEVRLARLPAPPVFTAYTGQTGTRFSFLCRDNVIRVFDFGAMRVVHEFQFPEKVIERSQPSDTVSNFLVQLRGGALWLCDAATGDSQFIGTGATDRPGLLDNTGRWLVTISASHRELQIRDATTGKVHGTIPIDGEKGFDFVFSPDGRRLATTQRTPKSTTRSLQLWSVPDGRELSAPMPVPDSEFGNFASIFFSRDGKHLIFWGRTSIEVRDGQTGRALSAPVPYIASYGVSTARFTRDGKRMVTWQMTRGAFTAWDLASGQRIGDSPTVDGSIRDLQVANDDRTVLTTSTDGYVRVWDLDTRELVAEPTLQQPSTPRGALAPDGRSFTLCTSQGELYRFPIERGGAGPLDLPWPNSQFTQATFLPDSPIRVLSPRIGELLTLDISGGRQTKEGLAYPAPLIPGLSYMAVLTSDFKTLVARTAAEKTESWRFNGAGIAEVVSWQEPPEDMEYPAVNPVGNSIAFHEESNIRVWDAGTGKPISPRLRLDQVDGKTIRFSPNGRLLAAGSAKGETKIWEAGSWNEIATLQLPSNVRVLGVEFNPTSTRIVVTNRVGEVGLFDANSGQPVSPVHRNAGDCGSFSPDGRYLLTWLGQTLRLWDGNSGAPLREKVFPDSIREIWCDSTGSRLAVTGNSNQAARIWDMQTLEPITEPMRHPGTRVVRAIFSPDNRFIMVDTVDHKFHFWSLPPPLPAGDSMPGWLLDLATACAAKTIDSDGKLAGEPEAVTRFDELRRVVAALPADAPLAEWGRWFFADRATRSIAPGFTITPVEATQFTARHSGSVNSQATEAGEDPP
jgi:serine/threonine protein kinase/WD40 repeat protein